MFDMFIRERLEMASKDHFPSDDAFEYKINILEETKAKRRVGLKPAVRSLSRKISGRHLNISGSLGYRNSSGMVSCNCAQHPH